MSILLFFDSSRSMRQASLEPSSEHRGCSATMKKINRIVIDNGSGYLFYGENHAIL